MSFKHIYSVGFIYFFILMFIALFIKDVTSLYSNEMFLTANELLVAQGYGDPRTFIGTALQIVEDGWITSKNQWVFNLWPPGFILLESLIIKIFGPEVPIIFVLQILVSALFSIVLTLFYKLIYINYSKYIAFSLPLVIFIFPVSRAFLLEPLGISFGESFSIGFFLLFVLLVVFSHINNSLKEALLAGLFLGLAAYFRSSFGAILISISFFGLLIIFIFYLFKIWKKREVFEKNIVIRIAVIIFAAFIISLPWKIYKTSNENMRTSVLIFKTLVKTNATLKEEKAGWVMHGRGNMMCLVDESTCSNKNNDVLLLARTFILNPIKWYSIRAEVIGDYWFSNTEEIMTRPMSKPTFESKFINGIILFMLIALVFLTIKIKKDNIIILLTWINISLFSVYLAVFTVVHYEVRYFYFPKIYIIFMFLLMMYICFRQDQLEIKDENV
jgi:hypothetical protein